MIQPTLEDLSPFGKARFEDDFSAASKREKCSRADFGAGWIAMAVRLKQGSFFTARIAAAMRTEAHG